MLKFIEYIGIAIDTKYSSFVLCKSRNFSLRCSIYLVKGSGEEKLLEAKMLNVAKNTGMNI